MGKTTGKDPAFLFYPGDYLQDVQCFTPETQKAYDLIMCQHMKNICISQSQLNSFTNHLSSEEKTNLLLTMVKIEGGIELITGEKIDGFAIAWIADSIKKRKAYSESRRRNRSNSKSKNEKSYDNTYVPHMVNENENVIVIKEEVENENSQNLKINEFETFESKVESFFKEIKFQVFQPDRAHISELGIKLKNKIEAKDPGKVYEKFIDLWKNLGKDQKWWKKKRNNLKYFNECFEEAFEVAFGPGGNNGASKARKRS